jgi:hypothetical protein
MVIVNFKRMVNPSLVPQPRLGEVPSSRDGPGRHTIIILLTGYNLHDSGWKLTIVIQVAANLMLIHPSVVADARLVFQPNFIRLQYLHYAARARSLAASDQSQVNLYKNLLIC